MKRILICDNDIEFMDHIEEILSDIENISISKMRFTLCFIDEVKSKPYDIIIMNTEYGVLGNGISIAKIIRGFDDAVKIIFVAEDTRYCFESYSVKASGFLLKSTSSVELCTAVEKCIDEISGVNDSFVCLPIKSGFIRAKYYDIEYIDVYRRRVEYHFIDGRTEYYIGYIKTVVECLAKFNCFYHILRSCIINMNCILRYENRNIYMISGNVISIGEKKSKEVKTHIQEWLNNK